MMNENLASEIVKKAVDLGYAGCGILRLSEFDLSLYADRLDKRSSRFPEATGIQALKDAFLGAIGQYPWAKSMIVCKFWLDRYRFPKSLQGKYGKAILL